MAESSGFQKRAEWQNTHCDCSQSGGAAIPNISEIPLTMWHLARSVPVSRVCLPLGNDGDEAMSVRVMRLPVHQLDRRM